MLEMKKCSKCGDDNPLSTYSTNSGVPHAYPYCKTCASTNRKITRPADNARKNPTRSTIDGFRTTRSAHIKAGRIEMKHGEQDERGMYWDQWCKQFRSTHPSISQQSRPSRNSRSTIDGIRTTRAVHIKAGRIIPTEEDEDGTERSGSPEVKAKGNGHTNMLQADHIYPKGGGHRLAPLPPRNKGVTDAEVDRTESWFYSIVKDPWMYPNTKKTGNTRQEPDKYANRPYRAALDVTHINVFDLYFSLIYKAKRNGITIEKRVQRKLRAIFTPTHRPEEVLCDDPIEYRRVLMAICAEEPDLELWYDEEQGGWLKEERKKVLDSQGQMEYNRVSC